VTQTFFLGQLRLVIVAFIAYATGRGWLTPADSGLAGSILPPIGALIGPWIWSIYVNINSKLVPKDSVAISKDDVKGAAVTGATVAIPADTVKVVG
jgi:hypothetical protein